MNAHEIITILALLCPAFYALGCFDRDRNEDGTQALAALMFAVGVISAAVAITLRISN